MRSTTNLSLYDDDIATVEVVARTTPATAYNSEGTRYLVVRFGDGAGLAIQGDPVDVLALVERIRDEVIASIGAAWPVETAHAGVMA